MTRDLANQVMGRVVRYEQRRAKRWWWVFWALMTVIAIGLAVTIASIVVELREDNTLSILDAIKGDEVALTQAWRDVVGVIWEDLTHVKIYALVIGLAVAVGAVLFTRRRRRILARAKREMAAMQGTGQAGDTHREQ